MRLIDADKLEPHEIYDNYGFAEVVYMDDIREMPTIEAEPVRHGKWVKDGNTSRCSECGYAPISKIFFRGEKIWEISLIDEYHYCPYCGAKMDAKEESDEADISGND